MTNKNKYLLKLVSRAIKENYGFSESSELKPVLNDMANLNINHVNWKYRNNKDYTRLKEMISACFRKQSVAMFINFLKMTSSLTQFYLLFLNKNSDSAVSSIDDDYIIKKIEESLISQSPKSYIENSICSYREMLYEMKCMIDTNLYPDCIDAMYGNINNLASTIMDIAIIVDKWANLNEKWNDFFNHFNKWK